MNSHIPPSTTAFLIDKFPLLESTELGSYSVSVTIDLPEEDIMALQSLDRVKFQSKSGGMRVVARVGRPVVSVQNLHLDDLDAALELFNCPQLFEVHLKISNEEMRRFMSIVPQLPRLRIIRLSIDPELSSKDFEDAAMEAVKILHNCYKPSASVSLRCLRESRAFRGGTEGHRIKHSKEGSKNCVSQVPDKARVRSLFK